MNKTIKKAIELQQEVGGTYDGIDFLRDAVEWFNDRNEHSNHNKTVNQLLTEYAKTLIVWAKKEEN